MRKLAPPVVAVLLAAVAGCHPSTVTEAEAQRDVAWLGDHPGRASMEALSRLADHDERAREVLMKRRGDADVYVAAWQAHTRGAPWGEKVLRAGLVSPDDLPLVVGAIPSSHPRLAAIAGDLASGVRAGKGESAAAAAALLASVGPAAEPPLAELVASADTRDAACAGLASPQATPEARMILVRATADARTSPACRTTIFRHASIDGRVLDWLGREGEASLIAASVEKLDCPKQGALWDRVFASSRESLVDVEPALAASMSKCAAQVDPVTARALPGTRRARSAILHALAVEDAHAEKLEATCKQLPRLSHGRSVDDDVRSLAGAVHGSRCKSVL